MKMFSDDADLFFKEPPSKPQRGKNNGNLYLLRRDISICLGKDPDTQNNISHKALFPACMAILTGIDLVAKFYDGHDKTREVGTRFCNYLKTYLNLTVNDANTIYALRNALLHSFGLYSKNQTLKLSATNNQPLIQNKGSNCFTINILKLNQEFENSLTKYMEALNKDKQLQVNFAKMFKKYGKIYID